MLCVMWYHFYSLKKVKTPMKKCYFYSKVVGLNCTNGTKSCNASHIYIEMLIQKQSLNRCCPTDDI